MNMSNKNIDALLKDSLTSNELPPPDLMNQMKSAAREREAHRRGRKRFWGGLAVAALCLSIVVSAAAVGTNFFGLRDLTLPDPEHVFPIEHPNGTLEEQPITLISMQGFTGSPEHAAATAWQTFLNDYDLMATLAATGNDWGDVPREYWIYGAYSMEMVEKIHEILETYDLTLLGEMLDLRTPEEFFSSIAYGPLFGDASIWGMGYLFESGTFGMDGFFDSIGFQIRASRKGVFDNVALNVGDMANISEWHYENIHGAALLLAQSAHQSLIFFESETTFVTVNILIGAEGNEWGLSAPFTPGNLEQFADLIDFGQLREGPPDPDLMAIFEAQRADLEARIAFLVGTWTHVKSESEEYGVFVMPMYREDFLLKIQEDRSIFFLQGEGTWAFYTNQADFLAPESFIIRGDLISTGMSPSGRYVGFTPTDKYEFQAILSFIVSSTSYPIDGDRLFYEGISLQYDPILRLLRYTDWEGYHHFFERAH